jgi:hypothetical protein
MYARNVMAFVQNFVVKGEVKLSTEDEINRDTMVTRDGDVVGARLREALGMPALAPAAASA